MSSPSQISYKYQKEIEPKVSAFLDDMKQKVLILGTFNLNKEPWRLLAVAEYRKYNLKIRERKLDEKPKSKVEEKTKVDEKPPSLVELSLVKQKLSCHAR